MIKIPLQCRRHRFNPGSGRLPGEGNGNPVQYSCLGNPSDRSLVGYSPWSHKESDTTEQLNNSKKKTIPQRSKQAKSQIPKCLPHNSSQPLVAKKHFKKHIVPCHLKTLITTFQFSLVSLVIGRPSV